MGTTGGNKDQGGNGEKIFISVCWTLYFLSLKGHKQVAFDSETGLGPSRWLRDFLDSINFLESPQLNLFFLSNHSPHSADLLKRRQTITSVPFCQEKSTSVKQGVKLAKRNSVYIFLCQLMSE